MPAKEADRCRLFITIVSVAGMARSYVQAVHGLTIRHKEKILNLMTIRQDGSSMMA
jgi:hypothetical protein